MARIHLTPAYSQFAMFAAIADGNDDKFLMDNGALVLSSSAHGIFLDGGYPWKATINGLVGTFDNSSTYFGVRLLHGTMSVGRTGEVFGALGGASVSGSSLTNRGTISGGDIGVRVFDTLGLTLTNKGLIQGGDFGVQTDNAIVTIVNSGLISGDRSISNSVNETVFHIHNSGTLAGDVTLSGAADDFTNTIKTGNAVKSGKVVGLIDLGGGDDVFRGGSFAERVRDGAGGDSYKLAAGNDVFRADKSGGADGTDTVDGGSGFDWYDLEKATNSVIVNLDSAEHYDIGFTRGAGFFSDGSFDNVFNFENVIGSGYDDIIVGSKGGNRLLGGGGADGLTGLGGKDVMTGGAGEDNFWFLKLSDSSAKASKADVITDFTAGEDHIELEFLEAAIGHNLTFAGAGPFTHGYQFRYAYRGSDTLVSIDANADNKTDFAILLKGHIPLGDENFFFSGNPI